MLESIVIGIGASLLTELAKILKVRAEVIVALLCILGAYGYILFNFYASASMIEQVQIFAGNSIAASGCII